MKHTPWELMQIQKYPELSPAEAIKKGREDMGARSRGNSGNPNPHLKGNSEKARELQRLSTEAKLNKG